MTMRSRRRVVVAGVVVGEALAEIDLSRAEGEGDVDPLVALPVPFLMEGRADNLLVQTLTVG